eukprot:1381431-Amorphochlora_amoeboformis.AAC.1
MSPSCNMFRCECLVVKTSRWQMSLAETLVEISPTQTVVERHMSPSERADVCGAGEAEGGSKGLQAQGHTDHSHP